MYFNQSLNLISHNDNPIIRIADDGAIIDAKPNVVCKIIAIWLTLSANDDFKYAPIKLTVYWYSTVNNEVNRLGEGANTTDKETLYGACNYIFRTLLDTFPNADIVVILQPVNYANTVPTTEEGATNVGFDNLAQVQGMTDAQYSSYVMMRKEVIVREMAERYGLPICDCCFEWYNPNRANEATKYWQSDKLHLTAEGHQAVIDKLEKVVNNLPFERN